MRSSTRPKPFLLLFGKENSQRVSHWPAACTPCAAEIIRVIIIHSRLTISISPAILFCTGAIEEFPYISVAFVPQGAHVFLLRVAAHPAVRYCPAAGFAPLSLFCPQHCVSLHGSFVGTVQMPTLAELIREHTVVLMEPGAPTRQLRKAQAGKAVPRKAAFCIASHLCAVVCLKI